MDKKLKDLKDEVLVVTNAAEGNTAPWWRTSNPKGDSRPDRWQGQSLRISSCGWTATCLYSKRSSST